MELNRFRLPLAIALTVVYNLFFWQEKLGINLALFSLLIVGIVLFLNPASRHSRIVWLTAVGTVLTGVLVIFHNSGTAKFAHIASLLVFTGFAHLPSLRSLTHAIAAVWGSYLQSVLSLYEEFQALTEQSASFKRIWNHSRLILFPLVVLTVFFTIFTFANPRFATLSEGLFSWIGTWFTEFSITRFLFLLLGFVISVGLLYNRHLLELIQHESRFPDQLKRARQRHMVPFSPIGLKKEYLTGLMLMALVNGLLLINNVIDIEWIWMGFEVPEGFNLTQFVHEGTYLLILSIFLSMCIMLYYFRNNQHFFKKGGWLHHLSYLWIIQNVVLLISVGIRNYHYIAWHGLAYKRIGVIFFLFLTLVGLITLAYKIRTARSSFYLFRVNSWAVYAVMLMLACVNWDLVITRYNLTQDYPGELDRSFLLKMSDKALPLLVEYQEVFDLRTGTYERENLARRIQAFQDEFESYSWLSWNLADQKAYQYLESAQFEAGLMQTIPQSTSYRP